jgi:hypothetical protein
MDATAGLERLSRTETRYNCFQQGLAKTCPATVTSRSERSRTPQLVHLWLLTVAS